jgi:hypothetical protein
LDVFARHLKVAYHLLIAVLLHLMVLHIDPVILLDEGFSLWRGVRNIAQGLFVVLQGLSVMLQGNQMFLYCVMVILQALKAASSPDMFRGSIHASISLSNNR